MCTRSESGGGRPDPVLSEIIGERRALINIAYRMLGSLAEAEDVVQGTYARWYAMTRQQQREIQSPGAWLRKVTGRVCLDRLGSARVRRERYVGQWLPEPLPDHTERISKPRGAIEGDPADRVTLDESVSMAFLVVLDSMTPAERVAFVLHDVFSYSFADVAEIVGRTPATGNRITHVWAVRNPDKLRSWPAERQVPLTKRGEGTGSDGRARGALQPPPTLLFTQARCRDHG
jgi:RNA polymerase sigma-70 factor (ECF subfamily)